MAQPQPGPYRVRRTEPSQQCGICVILAVLAGFETQGRDVGGVHLVQQPFQAHHAVALRPLTRQDGAHHDHVQRLDTGDDADDLAATRGRLVVPPQLALAG